MLTDFLLASFHHLFAFSLVGLLLAEAVLVRPGLSGGGIRLLAKIDAAYGACALAIVAIGVARVLFGLKGWEFYVESPMFWVKMAAIGVAGVLSVVPTRRILAWRGSLRADEAFTAPLAEVATVRPYLTAGIAVLALVPALAAAMARGY